MQRILFEVRVLEKVLSDFEKHIVGPDIEILVNGASDLSRQVLRQRFFGPA
ncbi:MAG: hypothetical protein WCI05_02060 [Myxococcales bacterium]